MSRKMLIDAAHPEETRVVVVENNRVEEFDYESASRKPIRGNIYLAKVTRVEPSLQAAFVEYGGNKHGFLAFNEIHPDYYQIPHADREELRKQEAEIAAEFSGGEDTDSDEEKETLADDDELIDEAARKRRNFLRKYKIQEVIKRRQVLLVQVAKEERGNKGAALTTYLSLAGRYSVLMPNTARGGGISRKITNPSDRKRLKDIMGSLDVPNGMGLIVRTAGAKRTKTEIKCDFDYLARLWDEIRENTLKSTAPSLIHSDSDLVKRAIRDIYNREIEEVIVDAPIDHVHPLKPLRRAHLYEPVHHRQVAVELGVPRALDDVLAPALELVVVVGVLELLGRVDVAGVDDARARVAGPVDEFGDWLDGVLAPGGVQRAVRVAEAVLHVDDDDRGAVGVERAHVRALGRPPQSRSVAPRSRRAPSRPSASPRPKGSYSTRTTVPACESSPRSVSRCWSSRRPSGPRPPPPSPLPPPPGRTRRPVRLRWTYRPMQRPARRHRPRRTTPRRTSSGGRTATGTTTPSTSTSRTA